MRFSTPWTPDPDVWAKYVPETRSPGLEAECAGPIRGLPPVVQRFHDFFILPEGPLEISTPPPDVEEVVLYLITAPAAVRPATPPPPVRSWQVTSLLWGIHVSYEQAWHWLGSSLGELVESISLTPGEELEIQVYTWDRTKLSKDLEATDLVDQKYETSLTMHESSQIVKRMEKERNWEFGANVGFSKGVTVGVDFGIGGSTSDTMEQRREHKQEFTAKTAQQVRSERKTKISTVRETGIEERRRRLLKNENPTRTVTYNFYETLSHYQVEIAPVEIIWAVAIPNELPSITPEWVVCHEGVLREHLLDSYKEDAFAAAKRLLVQCPTSNVAEAARRLNDAFMSQHVEMQYGYSAPQMGRPGGDFEIVFIRRQERLLQTIEAFLSASGTELVGEAYPLVVLPDWGGGLGNCPKPNYEYIASFLAEVKNNPTLTGLIASLKLLADWYKIWEKRGSFAGDYPPEYVYEMSLEVEAAIGYAASVLVQDAGGAPTTTEPPEDGAEASPTQPLSAPTPEQAQALEERLADQVAFDGLKCHIEENLLHYMRPIWIAEDEGQRHARLTRQLLGGSAEEAMLATLIEDRLLGFHLNCSVFPVRMGPKLEEALEEALQSEELPAEWPAPQGPQNLISLMRKTSARTRSAVQTHFERLAHDRFQASARTLLDQSIQQALSYVENCGASEAQDPGQGGEPTTLTPKLLLEVMSDAEQRIHAALAAAQKSPESNLTKEEQEKKTQVEKWLENLSSVALNNEAVARIAEEVANAGRTTRAVEETQDLKPVVVSLPDGGYHCEPVVGRCSAAEPFREREIEADLALREAEAEQARLEAERRAKRLERGEFDAEPVPPVIDVRVTTLDENS